MDNPWAGSLSYGMHRFTPADYKHMPWRNGGGTTTEIVVHPEGGGLAGERFQYRVSIADVARDGPFSRFEGYDRHIMLLAGAGMTLAGGAQGEIELALFAPRSFSGDWDVHGSLRAGPVRDFNLIVDRASASSSLESRVVDVPERLAFDRGTVGIVHVIAGALANAAEGDTIVADAPFDLVPRGTARVAIGRVVFR
jgi:environmental stress-induced protein Ves